MMRCVVCDRLEVRLTADRTFKYAGGIATIRTLLSTTGMPRSAKCQAGETHGLNPLRKS
jgi:hypothetical protein